MPPAAAIAGAAVVGAGAQMIAGNKAAKAQQKAADQQIAEQRRQYDQTRADYEPWRKTGESALSKLAGMYGVGGATSSDPYGGYQKSPGYQFQLDEGIKAAERSAAARGILKSGASMKAIQRYGAGLADSDYQQYANSLFSLAGLGQNETNANAAAGQAATNNIINAYGNAGNARASSYANMGSAVNNGLNNAVSLYLYQQGGLFNRPGG